MTAITVNGGITAYLDDLLHLARLLDSGSTAVSDADSHTRSLTVFWQLDDNLNSDTLPIHLLVQALIGPFGRLPVTAAALDRSAAGLRAIVRLYEGADDNVLDSIGNSLGSLCGHLAASAGDAVTGHWSDAGHDLFDTLPAAVELAGVAARPLLAPATALLPDGHAEVTALGRDESATGISAPRTLANLVNELAWRNAGRHGEISVALLVGADGVRRAIVDIPGTKSWNPFPNHDVTSVGTDVRAMAGEQTSYEQGVLQAMRDAGVGADDQVMLVGHSEGGIVAIDTARDAVRSGQFNVTHVITAGSPIGVIGRQVPRTVRVLAFENSADVVPDPDGAPNPIRRDFTTVVGREQHYSIGADHDIEQSYEPIAVAADHSRNPALAEFRDSAAGFLDAGSITTNVYWVRRGY